MMEERHPYFTQNTGTNILGLFSRMNVAANLPVMGYLLKHPCISHVIKYTTEYHGSMHTF